MAIYGYQADRSYQAHSLVGRCCGSDEHSCKRRQNDIDQVMPSDCPIKKVMLVRTLPAPPVTPPRPRR